MKNRFIMCEHTLVMAQILARLDDRLHEVGKCLLNNQPTNSSQICEATIIGNEGKVESRGLLVCFVVADGNTLDTLHPKIIKLIDDHLTESYGTPMRETIH